jgi:hypothetical protein
MKIAIYGTSVSDEFIPVIEEFFEFLKKNRIEVQLFRPFYIFWSMSWKLRRITPHFFIRTLILTQRTNSFSVWEVTGLFYIQWLISGISMCR